MKKLLNIVFIALFRLLASTWRITVEGNIPSRPAVIAFWHGYMMPAWKYFSRLRPAAVVSSSKDGQILACLLERWNYTLVRGSSTRGGKEALDAVVDLLKDNLVLITPDGPRGPVFRFKAGAAVASLRTGAPVCLCSVHINKSKILRKSWDKFHIPCPFTRITLTIAPPVTVPAGSSREETDNCILNMENTLNEMHKEK